MTSHRRADPATRKSTQPRAASCAISRKRGKSPTPIGRVVLHGLSGLILSLGLFVFDTARAEEHPKARFDSGLPTMRTPMTVERVLERDPENVEARIALPSRNGVFRRMMSVDSFGGGGGDAVVAYAGHRCPPDALPPMVQLPYSSGDLPSVSSDLFAIR